jgi:predicted  nucleic acid-binding Zn-ribbon protein
MSDETESEGLRERLTKQSEDTFGRLAEDLLANPLVSGAIARAFEAREKATSAQEATFAALNIPTAADIERLTRRVRSVSQRLEGIEDAIDRVDERLTSPAASATEARLETIEGLLDGRLEAIESQIATLARELGALREALPGATEPVPAHQERMKVSG